MQFLSHTIRLGATVIALLFCFPVFLFALPEGEQVVAGSAQFDRSEVNALTINTPSEKLIVNYNSFNIAQAEAVRFNQPSASAVALNRVTGGDPSAILGTLSANGQVFIVNPNGILFGPESRVDVAGLVASTMNIADEDFLNGNYVFSQEGKGGFIINAGSITAQPGGFVVLLGQAVENKALIQADFGTVALASGKKATLSLENDSLISVVVDEAVETEVFGPDGVKMDSAVKNSGSILAQGGKVILTARILNRVFDYAINNTGLVQVTSLTRDAQGVLELVAEGAPVVNSGTLAADAVYIKVNDSITNAPEGLIIATPIAAINGGVIDLEAETVLQQGLISANALEEGTAGEITIVTQGNAILDENSTTEARATGVVGNGGKITIDSKAGSVFVNKNGKIDFSAGSLAGNGGNLFIGAFEQLGFYGILNGRAPPGYTPGKAILDPLLSSISGEFSSNIVIYSPGDIHIVGNIIVTGSGDEGYYFAILADHTSEEEGSWDDGQGAIINDGDYSILFQEMEGPELILAAGSGIGSMDRPIMANAYRLTAVINPASSEGDIFIDNESSYLEIDDIRSPGLVVVMSTGYILNGTEGTAITADELYLESGIGVGELYYYGDEIYYPLETNVRNLAVLNEGMEGVYIDNHSAELNILSIASPDGSDVWVSSDGDIRVIFGIRAEWEIDLTAANNIYISDFANLVTDLYEGSVSLTAETGAILRNPEPGLLGYWSFDGENDSGYYVYDQVTGQYAYVSGGPSLVWDEERETRAMLFDGVNDYINTYRYFNLGTGPFTLVVWYQGIQVAPYIGLVGATPGLNTGYTLENHNGYARYWLSREIADSADLISDGEWHMISMVRDGTEGSLYVISREDGEGSASNVAFSEFTVPLDSVDSYVPFWIGGWGYTAGMDGQSRLTQGLLDDVRVYNRALSGLELYAQTLVAPGAGRISAGRVELYAENGVNVGFGTVSDYYVSNNSGDIRIDSLSDLYVNQGNFDFHGYETAITDGDITLITAGNMYVNSDIYTIGDHDLTLTADGNIELAQQVSVYSNSDLGEGDLPTGYSGNVSLNAGQDVIFNYGASVYSYAGAFADLGLSGFAQSGDVTITAGRDIDMEFGRISSQANANGYGSCIAYSGDVILSAGHNIYESGWLELIYSQAYASVYENPDTTALAQSGLVSIYAGYSLSIDGRDSEYTYGADVFSYAYAYGGLTAEAYSSGVTISTGSGDISIFRTDVRSDAEARTFAAGNAGTSSDAIAGSYYFDYNNYEYGYLAVLVDAGGNIAAYDNTMIYGRAVASGSAFDSYARAGDVTLDARYAINLGSHIYSDSIANAGDVARAVSGKVNLISYYGPITVPETTLVWSNASANTIYEYSEAFAESDDVTVQCWYGPVTINQGVSSTAEAYGAENISPAWFQATSGNVSVGSGYSYAEYWTSIYGPYYYYYVGYFEPNDYYFANDLTVNSYIFSSTSTSSDNAQELRLTSGDVTLFGANISLTDGRVYSGINDDQDIPTAQYETRVVSGDIGFYTSGDISVSGYAEITSRAFAYCSDMETLATSVQATPGAITLKADGNIVIDLANLNGNYPIDSYGYASYYESMPIVTGDTIAFLADADWSGEGILSTPQGTLRVRGSRFDISGAQDIDFDGIEGLYVSSGSGELLSLNLIFPSELSIPGLSLASTYSGDGEGTLAINSVPYGGDLELVFEYMRFYSAGDIELYTSLAAASIELVADYNENGYGDLFSYIIEYAPEYGSAYIPGDIALAAWSHRIQAAGSFDIVGDSIHYGSGEVATFGAYLWTPDEGPLGDLSVTSTNGSIIVTDYEGEQTPLEREGAAGIDLWAGYDIVINSPIIVGQGGLRLISDEGSIVAGVPEEGSITHITAASDVYLQAGNANMEESNSMIGTIDAPLNILVTAGAVELEVYGQQTFLIDEVATAVSGDLTGTVNGSSEANAILVLNNAPGVVFFNNGPAPEYTEPEPPNPPYEPPPSPHEDEPESLPLPSSQPAYIDSYDPNPVDAFTLDAFQQSSTIGQFFLYHPITETDMGAFDQFKVGPDSYQLSNGNLEFVGPEGLMQFFEEFEQKRKQSNL